MLSQHAPIVSSSSKTIQTLREKPAGSLLVLSGNTIIYRLSERLPSTKYMYYYPWFAKVPEMRTQIYQELENKNPDYIVFDECDPITSCETYFDLSLLSQLTQQYSHLENGVFVRK
ncbi:MAG: hypothetical protein A2378_02005 [Candidatus Pacebacteria bacterium RIFOXYB1_FULL_44_10]|nr:MAG: hypothetical protein A2378_02005 [Candidatus Pacebacteria bacterium RIFOXYB1_FULL_44_10]